MPWGPGDDDLLRQKYAIQQQAANADTARAGAVVQDVNQRPGLQAASDAAALERARLDAQARLAAEQMRGGFGLQERAQANQGAATVAGIQGNFGLQERGLANQGAAEVARIHAGAATQPEYNALENPLFGQPGQKPYFLAPRNQSAVEALRPPVPGGVGPAGDGYGLNERPAASAGTGAGVANAIQPGPARTGQAETAGYAQSGDQRRKLPRGVSGSW